MSIEAIEDDFPNLRAGEWRISSEIDEGYNCVAFAVHDTRQFWDADAYRLKGYYWPPGVPRDGSINSWVRVFELHGHRVCDDGDLEQGFEKIAIYADAEGIPTHVARQLELGGWTSKLGPDEDIEHNTLEGLHSDLYGTVAVFMKRRRAGSAQNEQTDS